MARHFRLKGFTVTNYRRTKLDMLGIWAATLFDLAVVCGVAYMLWKGWE